MNLSTTVNSIEEYLSIIFNLSQSLKKNYKENEVFYYRGQSNKDYDLLPSIARNRTKMCEMTILDEERNLIEMAKYQLPNIFHNNLLPIDLLAILQHYGIPTRLLDITTNPLVALFFSVDDIDNDGEVILFKHNQQDYVNYPIINAIAESYKFAFTTFESLDCFYDKIIRQEYFKEQISDLETCFAEQSYGATWIKRCCKEMMFVRAQEQTDRQKIQQGKYILFPNDIHDSEGIPYFQKIISPIPKDEKHISKRIIIPKDVKTDFKDKLKMLGFSSSTLFQDNIDIICNNIVNDANIRVHNRLNY